MNLLAPRLVQSPKEYRQLDLAWEKLETCLLQQKLDKAFAIIQAMPPEQRIVQSSKLKEANNREFHSSFSHFSFFPKCS